MKVNEAAHAYSISTKELLSELKTAFPSLKLTANSELPEGFERTVQEQAQEYAEALNIALTETSGEVVETGEDVIIDQKVQEAFHYGILEAIKRTRSEDFALEGQIAAVEDIQAYQASYNEVWALFGQSESTIQENRNLNLNARLDAIAQTKADMGKQTGKDAQIVACVRNGKHAIKARLTELLG
ncbi:MAG: hypothetical protein KME46_33095 [Brasilonema angustatum HA4187-MV1]|jgi:hypothetical protein|nr:hypothetical protein [Brasilonema angustatum HA4187-MV1]